MIRARIAPSAIGYRLSAIGYRLGSSGLLRSAWSGSSKGSHQSAKHLLDLDYPLAELAVRWRSEVAEVTTQEELVFDLAGRTDRHLKEAREVGVASTTAALSDVRRDRSGGAPYLALKSVALFDRQVSGFGVNAEHQLMGEPPYLEASKVLHPVRIADGRPMSRGLDPGSDWHAADDAKPAVVQPTFTEAEPTAEGQKPALSKHNAAAYWDRADS